MCNTIRFQDINMTKYDNFIIHIIKFNYFILTIWH